MSLAVNAMMFLGFVLLQLLLKSLLHQCILLSPFWGLKPWWVAVNTVKLVRDVFWAFAYNSSVFSSETHLCRISLLFLFIFVETGNSYLIPTSKVVVSCFSLSLHPLVGLEDMGKWNISHRRYGKARCLSLLYLICLR